MNFAAAWEELKATLARTANNRTSMQQDVAARRRTEIDAISGAVLKHAIGPEDFPETREIREEILALQGNATRNH